LDRSSTKYCVIKGKGLLDQVELHNWTFYLIIHIFGYKVFSGKGEKNRDEHTLFAKGRTVPAINDLKIAFRIK
jgi:hypothetical protein